MQWFVICAIAVAAAIALVPSAFSEFQRKARLERLLERADYPDKLRPRLARNPRVVTMGIDFHADSVARFINGDTRKALQGFRDIAAAEPGAASRNDIAAAEIRLGDATHDPEHYLTALDDVSRALALDDSLSEALFNRALVIERIGFERTSIPVWREFIRRDPHSPWAELAQKHVDALSNRKTAREQWSQASGRILTISEAELDRLIAAYPQEARLWGDAVILPKWAESGRLDDLYLERAEFIAERLASRTGERFLLDSIAAIKADGQPAPLASAYKTYRDARIAHRDGINDAAARLFEQARATFAACHSPAAAECELYLAIIATQSNRIQEARSSLTSLLDREEKKSGHPALVADIQYCLAICSAMNGEFGDALAIAMSSRDTFQRLGEREYYGRSETLIADLLGFLGQPDLAWRHLIPAAEALSSSGEWGRLQACAATMNQIEMHRHHWSTARAISDIELALGAGPELRADAHLRNGAAAWQQHNVESAQTSLARARISANSVGDADARQKLLADIDGIEGRLTATSNPAAGIARLTASIDFQQHVGRAFALPDLYLDRGRAHLALGDRDSALEDFERGITSLETQRSRIRDYELRAGVFDDARALFAEAVDASLRTGNVARAFSYLERGRARALLDELENDRGSPQPASLQIVQQHLPPRTLLLSYARLRDRIAIFVIDREHADVRSTTNGNLLQAIDPDLDRATRLVIVPDPSLEPLSFAALVRPHTRKPLIETHEIVMEPSAAVYVACMRRSSRAPSTIAVFADPMSNLPAAYREAASLARHYPRALVLTRSSATAARFRREAANWGMVQFSGHATIDRAEPWKSALQFDVPLTAREIAAIHFDGTSVVILGACSTLAFDRERVEGTSTIATAFLQAGVPTVIGTLRDVDDADAAALIVKLHERLERGMPPAAALRDAQRTLIREGRGHDAWSAFVVMGKLVETNGIEPSTS